MKQLLIIIFSCLITGLSAQGYYYDDAQVRGHISIEKKFKKIFSVNLDQQYRWNNNVSELNRASFDIGFGWKIIKQIRLQTDYVFIQKRDKNEIFQTRNWYSLALIFKHEIQRWKFQYRNMLQLRYGSLNSNSQNILRLYDRNKLSVKYEATKRFTPYVAEEIYIPLNSPSLKGIERSRTYLGLLINTFRHQQLEFYFMYQTRLQKNLWYRQKESYPDMRLNRDYIYGIGYSFIF